MDKISVVAAAIFSDGRVLATQRGYGPQKGGWEFPGGKIEDRETPRQALAREIREELALDILVGDLIGTVDYDYPGLSVSISCYVCWICGGKLTLREASDARWLARGELDSVTWLPADRELLPKVHDRLEPRTILCYGDSNTYGYCPESRRRYGEDIRWTKRLARSLGEDFRVVEEGCNGRTAAMRPEDHPWKYGPDFLIPCLNSHKPVDTLILMLGTNDLKTVFCASAESIAGGLRQMILSAKEFFSLKQERPAGILLVSPPKVLPGIVDGSFGENFDAGAPLRRRELAVLCEKLAAETGCAFLDAADMSETSPLDSLHLSAEGHIKLAAAIERKLKEGVVSWN